VPPTGGSPAASRRGKHGQAVASSSPVHTKQPLTLEH
jgi:hypothetical protein